MISGEKFIIDFSNIKADNLQVELYSQKRKSIYLDLPQGKTFNKLNVTNLEIIHTSKTISNIDIFYSKKSILQNFDYIEANSFYTDIESLSNIQKILSNNYYFLIDSDDSPSQSAKEIQISPKNNENASLVFDNQKSLIFSIFGRTFVFGNLLKIDFVKTDFKNITVIHNCTTGEVLSFRSIMLSSEFNYPTINFYLGQFNTLRFLGCNLPVQSEKRPIFASVSGKSGIIELGNEIHFY